MWIYVVLKWDETLRQWNSVAVRFEEIQQGLGQVLKESIANKEDVERCCQEQVRSVAM